MSQKTKFAAAARKCRGISSRSKRNACVASHLHGFGSPRGRRHRGGRKHGRGTRSWMKY